MKKIVTFFAAALAGFEICAAPLVAFEAINNKSDNKIAKMETFPAAVMDRIVNSRRFEVCKTVSSLKKLQEKRIAENSDPRGYLIRVTVVQHSFIHKRAVMDRRAVISAETKIEAQLEYSEAKTGKVLESKRATASVKRDVPITGTVAIVVETLRLQTMEEAILSIADQCANRFLEMVYPVKILRIAGNSIYINAGQDRVAPGESLNIYKLGGESFIDPDTGENLGADEEYVATVQVAQAKQKYSIASVVSGTVSGDKSQFILRKCSTEQIAAPAASATTNSVKIDPHGANPF